MLPLLESSGVEIVDPFEHTPVCEDDMEKKLQLSEEIKRRCLELLESCDLIMAPVDFNETGTAFEVGHAHAVGKPVILISAAECSRANAMLLGAAKFAVDSVLESHGIEKVASVLRWYSVRKGDGFTW